MAAATHSLDFFNQQIPDALRWQQKLHIRQWNKDHRQPLCEFREAVQYLLPTSKQLPKMEQRFMP